MQKLIITVAVNGGITSRQKNPNVPYSPDEIAEAVYQSWNAGASIAHIHARDADGNPSYNAITYKEIIDKIRAKCDILINLSTSGLNLPADLEKKEAWNHLVHKPDIASFNCGSVTIPKNKNLNIPVFLSIRDSDTWVPLDRVVKTAKIFKSCNADVNLHIYPGTEHHVSNDEINEARTMLKKFLQGAIN